MLTRLRLHNFKTFLNFEMDFTRRHLLIGKNNSGKSNLCCALRFLGRLTGSDYNAAIAVIPGGSEALCHWGLDPAKPESRVAEFTCACELPFGAEALQFEYVLHIRLLRPGITSVPGQSLVQTVREQLTVSKDSLPPVVLLDSDGQQVRLARSTSSNGASVAGDRVPAPADAAMLCKVFEADADPRLVLFKRFLASIAYYSLSPQLVRTGWSLPDQQVQLQSRANLMVACQNLPLVLFQLKTQDEPRYREVMNLARVLEPDMDSINFFVTPDNRPVPYVIMRGGRKVGWEVLSDGSLCALAFATVFQEAEVWRELPGWPPATVMLEEPENHLFVGQLASLWERLWEMSPTSQFIFTSHSPYFIDLFERSLPSVTRLKRDGSITTARSLVDYAERIRRERDEYDASVGEQHFREVFE